MSMCAEIIAIGPFSRGIAPYLEYSERHYENTHSGAVISCTLFGIREGNSLSADFAACLGTTDPWDFNQHHIDSRRIDFDALRAFSTRYEGYSDDVEALFALVRSGFQFHFVPNG